MGIAGTRVGIIGGSIAGCSAAIALERLGCDVSVFERSSGALRDRGSGIIIPIPLRDRLIDGDYLSSDYANCPFSHRWWVLADGSPGGRLLWQQPSQVSACNWGVLWRGLRSRVPDARYHDGVVVTRVIDDGVGVVVHFSDAAPQRFAWVVGADGYNSQLRTALGVGGKPAYAGYVLWRGNYPEQRLADRSLIEHADASSAIQIVPFDGGHCVLYTIPDFDEGTEPGRRRVNWALYAAAPEGIDFSEPRSIAPGQVPADAYASFERLVESVLPPAYQAIVRASPHEEVSIQPVYDAPVKRYVKGRVLLIGDAGTVSRPHTGSGATKALEDALALERLGKAHDDWVAMLADYDRERTDNGMTLVELGKRMGRDQVQNTPPWASMTAEDLDEWTKQTLSGVRLYLYGNARDDEG